MSLIILSAGRCCPQPPASYAPGLSEKMIVNILFDQSFLNIQLIYIELFCRSVIQYCELVVIVAIQTQHLYFYIVQYFVWKTQHPTHYTNPLRQVCIHTRKNICICVFKDLDPTKAFSSSLHCLSPQRQHTRISVCSLLFCNYTVNSPIKVAA